MPLITFEASKLSDEIKLELIQKLTNISAEITGIPKESFFISIREMPDENVAIGGITVKEIKKRLGRT
jgi:4-oxalocrotonate tautomerase